MTRLDRVQYLIDELDHLNYRDLLKLKAEIEEQLKTFAEVYRMVSFPRSGDGSTEPASSPESLIVAGAIALKGAKSLTRLNQIKLSNSQIVRTDSSRDSGVN